MVEETIKALINMQNTYIGEAPIEIGECQWIQTSAGSSKLHFDKETYDSPLLSIYVRGNSHVEVKERTNRIYDLVKNRDGLNMAIIIRRLPSYIGRDSKYRTIYTFQIEYQLGGY